MWAITGNQATISWNDNTPGITGARFQSAKLQTSASTGIAARIDHVGSLWSIYPSTAPDFLISPGIGDFHKQVKSAPHKTHFCITWFSDEDSGPPAIGFTICLPSQVFQEILPCWRGLLFTATDAHYSITLDFLGFKTPGADSANPTPDEWMAVDYMARKPAIGNGVTIAFHCGKSD